MIEIGAIIGIISPNQMATGVFSMPVVMIFFLQIKWLQEFLVCL